MSSKKRLISYSLLLLALSAILVVCVTEFFHSEEVQGYQRQYAEEKMAERFLQDIQTRTEAEDHTQEREEESNPAVPSSSEAYIKPTAPADQVDLDYSDNNYEVIGGIRYTPEYAVGHIDCVLEIPKIRLRRGVYTGTPSEIQHDLDIWMTTTAHTDYVLGETHYCIYGHNSPTQNLSFNNLKNVEAGDVFLLTTEDSVYLYDVTAFIVQWRELVKWEITDNFSQPSDKCYIITCGRDQYRYKDIIVVGTLRKQYSIDEWYSVEENTLNESPAEYETLIEEKISEVKEPTVLSIKLIDDLLQIQLTDMKGEGIPDTPLCITDSDGLFLSEINQDLQTGADGFMAVPVSVFNHDEYYSVGILSMLSEKFSAPPDQEFMIRINNSIKEITAEEITPEQKHFDSYMILWAVLLVVLFGLWIVCLIRVIRIAAAMRKERG